MSIAGEKTIKSRLNGCQWQTAHDRADNCCVKYILARYMVQMPYQRFPVTYIIIFLQCMELYRYTVLSVVDAFRVVFKTFDMDKFSQF